MWDPLYWPANRHRLVLGGRPQGASGRETAWSPNCSVYLMQSERVLAGVPSAPARHSGGLGSVADLVTGETTDTAMRLKLVPSGSGALAEAA